jgi:hypothetical protein
MKRYISLTYKKDRFVSIFFTVFSGFALLITRFPGVFSPDSIVIVSQGSGLAPKSNWHSPILREIWSVISRNGAHPVWIFLFQALIYAITLYLLLSIQKTLRHKFLVLAIFTNPITFNIVGYVGKDAWIFLLALLTYTIYFRNKHKSLSLTTFSLISISIILTSSFRTNAVFIFIPMLWMFSKHYSLMKGVSNRLSQFSLCLGLILLTLFISSSMNSIFTGRDLSPQNTLLLWDAVGVGIGSSKVDIPDQFLSRPKCSVEKMKSQYSTRIGDSLFWGEDSCLNIVLPEDYQNQEFLFKETKRFSNAFSYRNWIKLILENPIEYSKHRIAIASNLLGIQNFPTGVFIESSAASSVRINVDPYFRNQLHLNLYRVLNNLQVIQFFFLPVIWFLILLSLKHLTTANFTRWSLPYSASMVLLSPGTDLRYMYPVWGFVILSFANLKDPRVKSDL